MGYTALYRKFRPMKFEEMVGQEHIKKTIKNQIINGRVGHAYLFNGCRGTGKTSAAKILARAVNCLNPQDGEPCNECEICKEAITGALTDIVEMDAASNNSVEDIRSIREEVNFLPSKAKYRVYIIDEVHMLSIGAFNALLKTLEEPPAHVKFILATTEPQKLPATILSRCQRFDFKRISDEDIIKRLKIVCSESDIEITEEALKIVAVLSEGAMRDALSILERCIQDGNTNINEDKIKDLVGIPQRTYIENLVEAVIECNVDNAIDVTSKILGEGKDINNLLWETIKYIKDVLVCKSNGKIDLYNEQELIRLKEIAEKITKQDAIKMIYDFSKLENDIKLSTQKTIVFEAGIISLCNRVASNESESHQSSNVGNISVAVNNEINQRISKIENYIRNNKISMQQSTTGTQNVENASANQIKTKIKIPLGKTQEYWPQIIDELKKNRKMMIYTNLINTTAREINENTIGVEFPNGLNGFGKTVLESQDNLKLVNDLISTACGKEMQVKYIDNNIHDVEYKDSVESQLTNFANGNGIPFNIQD